MKQLKDEMERIRSKMYQALNCAGGDQKDPAVQRISREFDRVLVEYMRKSNNESCSHRDRTDL